MHPSVLLLVVVCAVGAVEVPYGHPDFYPSPERPLGWRGDGTGCWPGAGIPASWNAETGEHVAWHVDTPGAGLCQPIVAGEKVFVTADPDLLLCYDVHDGELLWRTAIDHTLAMPAAERERARAEQAFFDSHWRDYATWRCELTDWIEACKEAGHSPKRSRKAESRRWLLGMGHQGGQTRLPHEDEPEHARIVEALEEDPELLARYRELRERCETNGWTIGNGNSPLIHGWPLEKRYREAQERWDIWCPIADNWLGFTTYSIATPVTDGEYVYVTTANNAVAAVDYDGEIEWLIWEHLPDQTGVLHTRYVPSPVLHDGRLVVFHQGHLCVYDAGDGEKQWSIYGPRAVAAGEKPRKRGYPRGDPEGVTPVVGTLAIDGGGEVGIVIDGGGQIWRLADGEQIGTTPAHKFGTAVLLDERGLYVGAGRTGVLELTAASRDRVTTTVRWSSEGVGDLFKFNSALVVGDRVIGNAGKPKKYPEHRLHTPVYDLDDGTPSWPWGRLFPGDDYISKVATGDRLYSFAEADRRGHDWNLFRDYEGTFEGGSAPLSGGEQVRFEPAFIDRRYRGDDEWAILNKTHCSGYQQNASPSVQANRLFYRTRGTLWCIGETSRRFPVPESCPDHARTP